MRILKKSGLLFISVWAVMSILLSAAAVGQSSASSPSSQAPSAGQSAPTQAPPPAQSQAPGASETPSNNSPNAARGAQQNNSSSIDEELQLTEDQKQKIAAVVDDENRQISSVRDDNSMTLEQKQQKVLQIRQAGTPKIKGILTPEQLQKLAAIQQRMREQQGNGQGQPPTQNPQH